jgi:hypothetical protein
MFVAYQLNQQFCGNCNATIRVGIGGFASGLGPTLIECRKCGTVIRTNFTEWPALTRGRKAWYIFASLVYSACGGFIGGLGLIFAVGMMNPRADDSWVPLLFGVWAVLIAVIQCVRVVRSIRRVRDAVLVAGGPAARLDVNVQVPLMCVWVLQCVAAVAIGVIVGR